MRFLMPPPRLENRRRGGGRLVTNTESVASHLFPEAG